MIDKSIYKDVPAYYHYYLDLVETTNLIAELEKSKQSTQDLIWGISGSMENYAYAENKWTIKEVFRHIIDCERIFTYRAFRFSRFDNTELAGFEEDEYIAGTKTMKYSLDDLVDEYLALRNATINLFKPMTDEMLDFKGMANKGSFTARTLGYITVGHNTHHCDFVKRKYLNDK